MKRKFVLGCFALLLAATGALAPMVGTDFFPTSDVGILKLHVRAPRGMRLEETEKIVAQVEQSIREIIPAKELRTINATIGVPFSLNLAFVPSDNTSGMDAEMLISLNHGHKPTVEYQRLIREKLNAEFPGTLFYFQTADIVSQVLNFGLAAPIDIQIQDANFPRAYASAQRIMQRHPEDPGRGRSAHRPGPGFPDHADRRRPPARRAAGHRPARRRQQHADVACRQRAGRRRPTILNPQNGVNYIVAVQTPADKINTVAGHPEPAGQSGGAQHQSEHSARPRCSRCRTRR